MKTFPLLSVLLLLLLLLGLARPSTSLRPIRDRPTVVTSATWSDEVCSSTPIWPLELLLRFKWSTVLNWVFYAIQLLGPLKLVIGPLIFLFSIYVFLFHYTARLVKVCVPTELLRVLCSSVRSF
jgi:hypothetical protein